MIHVDLILDGASEVVTMAGVTARDPAGTVAASVIPHGAVALSGGRIAWVGPASELADAVVLQRDGLRLDVSGCTVLPGLLDPHTHPVFAGSRAGEFRQRLAGATYEEIAAAGGGIRSTVEATRAATTDELLAGTLDRLDRMLLHGVTTVEAKSGYGLTEEEEIRLLEVLARAGETHPVTVIPTLLAAHVVPPEFQGRRREWVEIIVTELIPRVAGAELARFVDVFVEEGAFTPDEARAVAKAAREQGLGLRLHVDQLTPGGGGALAAELGAVSADHLEHVDVAGMAALARAGTVAVLLPAVNLFLRKATFPPARRLVAAGVPVALATDCNPGSCMTENLTLCASLACMTTGLDTDAALAGITVQAARSLDSTGQAGVLEAGRPADLAVFAVPSRTDILYRFGMNHVRDVIKGGRLVVREGRLLP